MMTRAIGLIIIIGHRQTLEKNADWAKIIDYTTSRCGGEWNLLFNGGDRDGDDGEEREEVDYDHRC